MALLNAPRRGFGGHRINTPMKSSGMPAPAGTGGSMPQRAYGGGLGGINYSGSGYGMPSARRTGNWDHRFTDGTPGQPQIQAGISTAQSPGGLQSAGNAPMAFEDGGAVDDKPVTWQEKVKQGFKEADKTLVPPKFEKAVRKAGQVLGFEDGGAIDDGEDYGNEPDAPGEGEEAAPTGNSNLENNDTDKITSDINAALAKVDGVFEQGRANFGLVDGWRRSNNVDDDRDNSLGSGIGGALSGAAQSLNFNPMDALRKLGVVGDEAPSATAAIPGTMSEGAGYNDIGPQNAQGDTTDEYRRDVRGYEDGGAVDDDENYDPSLSDTGNVGTPPPQQSAVPDEQTPAETPRLAAYVQGEGAAAPDEVQRYLQRYKHLPMEQATVQALADAASPSELVPGQEMPAYDMDATSLLQGYRQHYDHGRAYAFAAANGNAQKPANLQDSVKAANDAFPYVPDGERVHFSVGDKGNVNVAIGGPNGEPRANTTITPEQYKAFLLQSDFDSTYERTPSLLLQSVMQEDLQKAGITTGPTQAQAGNAPQQEFMVGQAGVQPSAGPGQQAPQQQQNRRVIPGRTDEEGNPLTPDHHPGYNMYKNARGTYYVPEDLDARSAALTGNWVSREEERQKWLNEQMQQGTTNEINMMKARNPLGVQELRNQGSLARTQYASDLKAGWEDRRTQGMIINNLDKIRAQHQNEQARNAANIARSILLGGGDPAEVPDMVKKMTGVDMSRLLNLENNTPQSPNAGNSRNPPPTGAPQFGTNKNTQVEAPPQTQTMVLKDGTLVYKLPGGGWSKTPPR